MEITVKTTKFGEDGVVIELREVQAQAMTPFEAANVLTQAERAGKVPALEARVQELSADLKRSADYVSALEDDLQSAGEYINELKTELAEQTEEREQNRKWAELAAEGVGDLSAAELAAEVARLEIELAERTREREENRLWAERAEENGVRLSATLVEIESKLAKIQEKVWNGEVDYLLAEKWTSQEGKSLIEAIAFIRATTGQP